MTDELTQLEKDSGDLSLARQVWASRAAALRHIRRLSVYRNKTAGMKDDLARHHEAIESADKVLEMLLGGGA